MAFYDIHYGNGSAFDASPSGHTGGNWDDPESYGSHVNGYLDSTNENRIAAIAKAALINQQLPSNQPNKVGQGGNFTQGLMNLFGAQQKLPYISTTQQIGPDGSSILGTEGKNLSLPLDISGLHSYHKPAMDVDSLLKNPNWNLLYSVDPDKANRVFRQQHPEGKTFDEVLKDREDQQKFVKKTVQERIAGNKLRQGVTGQWEESMDIPADPNNPLDKGGQKWVPASYQTQDLIKRAGGPEGVGLGNYSNLPLAEMSKALTGAGITGADAQKAWLAQNGLVKPKEQAPPPASSAPILNRIKSDETVGMIPSLLGFKNRADWQNARTEQPTYPQQQQDFADQYKQQQGYDEAGSSMVGPALLNNLKTLFMGGKMQSLNSEVTNDDMTRLHSLLNR